MLCRLCSPQGYQISDTGTFPDRRPRSMRAVDNPPEGLYYRFVAQFVAVPCKADMTGEENNASGVNNINYN